MHKEVEGVDDLSEPELVPLRKKLKRRDTGKEDNFMPSYYEEAESVRSMTMTDAELVRLEHGIDVEGDNIPNPIREFHEAGLTPEILAKLAERGVHKPTPIQMQALSCVMSGRDIIGNAETGSGKTLAYTLPLCAFLRAQPPAQPGQGPLALIIAPTRELVEQVYSEVTRYLPQSIQPSPPSTFGNQTQSGDFSAWQPGGYFPNYSQFPDGISPPLPPPAVTLTLSQPTAPPFAPLSSNFGYQPPPMRSGPSASELAQMSMWASKSYGAAAATTTSSTPPPPPPAFSTESQPTMIIPPPPPPPFPTDFSISTSTAELLYNSTPHNSNVHKVLGVCGGLPVSTQIPPLLRGMDVLVSTPGRLIDLVERRATNLERVQYLVLDEADRMLEMEMETQIRKIIELCGNRARQTLLFSATMPLMIEALARTAVLNPIRISVGSVDVIAKTVEQNVVFMHSYQKKDQLLRALRSTPTPPVLVFCNTHHQVDYIVNVLKAEQFHVAGLHGEKNQAYRFRVIKAFKEGTLDVLVATDLASRGIDVNDITHVVMFDMPDSIEDYIHRAGRTGRAGKAGKCTAFLTLECKIAPQLKKLLQKTKQEIPAELENTKKFGGDIIKTELGDKQRS